MAIDFFDVFTDRLLFGGGRADAGRPFNMAAPKRYPLSDDNKYNARVTFQVVDEKPSEIPGDILNIVKTGGGLVSGIGEAIFGSDAVADFEGQDKETLAPSEPTEFTTASDFGKISLYLPQALNIQDAVTYDNNVSLGRIGAMTEAALAKGSEDGAAGLGKAIGLAAAEGVGALFGGKLSPTVATVMAQKRAAKSIDQGVADAIRGSTQVAVNPNNRTLFKSVPIRQFSFTFTLIASSKSEADEIEGIIEAFRTELYPEEISVAGIDFAYKFPRRFIIRAAYNDKEWRGIKFLPCYLQSFTAQYNPNGMGFHRDGKWTEVQINMAFSESKALAKQDIRVGY